jgi:rhodanese-related sulfurtransferase
VGFALLANQCSPRGLSLTRDYFPSNALLAQPTNSQPRAAEAATSASLDPVAARLRSKGLQPADLKQVRALFEDPRYVQGLVVFLDARDDFIYQIGHIPGAHPFNHYRPQESLPNVMVACAPAEQVVVYCTGGDCEDSEFAAIMLIQAGIPADRVSIYTGGIEEWAENHLPVEVGLRGSGVMKGSAR